MDGLVTAQSMPLFNDQTCEHFHDFQTDPMISVANKTVLQKTDVLHLLRTVPISCVPELPELEYQPEPPKFEFFMNLPSVADIPLTVMLGSYLVYGLCMEHETEEPLFGIGSAGQYLLGAVPRMEQYDNLIMLPKYVKKALENDYDIVHICVLLLLHIPVQQRLPIHRLWTLEFEANYTYKYWTIHEAKESKGEKHQWSRFCPWSNTQFDYQGLNSHTPMYEGVRNIDQMLTAEEFLKMAIETEEVARLKQSARTKKIRDAERKAALGVELGTKSMSDPDVAKLVNSREKRLQYLRDRLEVDKQTRHAKADVKRYVDSGLLSMSDPGVSAIVDARVKQLERKRLLNEKIAFAREAHRVGILSDSDPDVERALSAQQSYSKYHLKRKGAMHLAVNVDSGLVEESQIEPEAQNLLKLGQTTLERRQRDNAAASKKRADGRKLAREVERGDKDEAEMDTDTQELLKLGRSAIETSRMNNRKQKEETKKAKKVALRVQRGETDESGMDTDTRKLLEKGKKALVAQRKEGSAAAKKATKAKQLARAVERGEKDESTMDATTKKVLESGRLGLGRQRRNDAKQIVRRKAKTQEKKKAGVGKKKTGSSKKRAAKSREEISETSSDEEIPDTSSDEEMPEAPSDEDST